jgi:hypothetical protein
LFEKIPECDPVPEAPLTQTPEAVKAYGEAVEAWAAKPMPEFEIGDKDAKIIAFCLKFWIAAGKVPSTKNTFELQRLFDVTGETD